MRLLFVCFLFCLVTNISNAEIIPMGTGMLFGQNHSFYFTAPKGWVLDNESGVNQGVHMIFYPEGETWASSRVISYGRSVTKGINTQNIEDQVYFTVQEFKDNGSPNYKSTKKEPIKVSGGKFVSIYFYEGDQWGNFEAVGYIEEEETINFLVYNTKSKKEFDQNISAFYSILHTYKNAFNAKSQNRPVSMETLIEYAKEDISTFSAQEYETEVLSKIGQNIADFMSGCTSYMTDQEIIPFDFVVKVEKSGAISESYIEPVNSLTTCYKGLMSDVKYPPHNFDRFYHHMEMRVQ